MASSGLNEEACLIDGSAIVVMAPKIFLPSSYHHNFPFCTFVISSGGIFLESFTPPQRRTEMWGFVVAISMLSLPGNRMLYAETWSALRKRVATSGERVSSRFRSQPFL